MKIEEDSGPKPGKEKETESPGEEDAGMTGEISDVNPLVHYIRKRTVIALGVVAPYHLVKDCPKEL